MDLRGVVTDTFKSGLAPDNRKDSMSRQACVYVAKFLPSVSFLSRNSTDKNFPDNLYSFLATHSRRGKLQTFASIASLRNSKQLVVFSTQPTFQIGLTPFSDN